MLSQLELDQAPKVTLAGRDFPIPHLAPRQQRIIVPKLMALMKFFTAADGKINPLNMDLTTAQFDDLLEVVYVALTRGSPNLPRDEFLDLPIEFSELLTAMDVISMQTGVLKRKGTAPNVGQLPPGEAMAGTAISTGTVSSPE